MEIETAEDAVEIYKSFDDWRYADREAVWQWMFEHGRAAEREACAKVCEEFQSRHNHSDNHGTYLAFMIRERYNDNGKRRSVAESA